MKNLLFSKLAVLFIGIYSIGVLSSCGKDDTTPADPNAWTDKDGHTYKTVKIGTQVWMAENLKTTTAPDGTSLGKLYQAYNSNLDTVGYQYSYAQAVKACPTGWHLPTDDEWKTLETYIGMPASELNTVANNIFRGEEANSGKKLKSTDTKSRTNWTWEGGNYGGTDAYGFNAYPGESMSAAAKKATIRTASFWSSTAYDESSMYFRYFRIDKNGIARGTAMTRYMFMTVRYIRDTDASK